MIRIANGQGFWGDWLAEITRDAAIDPLSTGPGNAGDLVAGSSAAGPEVRP
jgi:hypothetical protein